MMVLLRDAGQVNGETKRVRSGGSGAGNPSGLVNRAGLQVVGWSRRSGIGR